jgi:hypothetical protein
METKRKLCKDCTHCLPHPDVGVKHAKCMHPKSGDSDLVSGIQTPYSCRTMRMYKCGARAKYFEHKDVEMRGPTSWVDRLGIKLGWR